MRKNEGRRRRGSFRPHPEEAAKRPSRRTRAAASPQNFRRPRGSMDEIAHTAPASTAQGACVSVRSGVRAGTSSSIAAGQGARPGGETMAEYVRNAWYPAAWSRDIGRALIRRRILGEPVVLYR